MSEWNADENPYEILGLTAEATKEEQRKRYRRLVLEKHPDKQPGNKKAAEEFIKIQRAYEIITDDKAREAWAALQRAKNAREAKFSFQSEKRRKMAQDLEKREAAHEVERQQERAARDKLQAELARLKREMAEKEQQRQAKLLQERVASSLSASHSAMQTAQLGEQLQRTLKASWDSSLSSYTEQELESIFSTHGEVEEVILRPSKKKSKGSALIIMKLTEGAIKAANSVSGSLDNPLLVVPMAKAGHQQEQKMPSTAFPIPSFSHPSGQMPKGEPPGAAKPTFPGAMNPPSKPLFAAFHNGAGKSAMPQAASSTLSHSSFEEGIFAKMRRKAEEDRLAAGQPVKTDNNP